MTDYWFITNLNNLFSFRLSTHQRSPSPNAIPTPVPINLFLTASQCLPALIKKSRCLPALLKDFIRNVSRLHLLRSIIQFSFNAFSLLNIKIVKQNFPTIYTFMYRGGIIKIINKNHQGHNFLKFCYIKLGCSWVMSDELKPFKHVK